MSQICIFPCPLHPKMRSAGILSAKGVLEHILNENFPKDIHFDGEKISEKFTICFPGTVKVDIVLGKMTEFYPVIYFCHLRKEWILGEWAYKYKYPKRGIVTHYAYVL